PAAFPFVRRSACNPRGLTLDLVYRTFAQRDDNEAAVRAGQDVAGDAKAFPEQQALAPMDVPLVSSLDDSIAHTAQVEIHAIRCRLETEQMSIEQEISRAAHDDVPVIFLPQSLSADEAESCRRELEFPGQQRIEIVRPGEHEQPLEGLFRRVGN